MKTNSRNASPIENFFELPDRTLIDDDVVEKCVRNNNKTVTEARTLHRRVDGNKWYHTPRKADGSLTDTYEEAMDNYKKEMEIENMARTSNPEVHNYDDSFKMLYKNFDSYVEDAINAELAETRVEEFKGNVERIANLIKRFYDDFGPIVDYFGELVLDTKWDAKYLNDSFHIKCDIREYETVGLKLTKENFYKKIEVVPVEIREYEFENITNDGTKANGYDSAQTLYSFAPIGFVVNYYPTTIGTSSIGNTIRKPMFLGENFNCLLDISYDSMLPHLIESAHNFINEHRSLFVKSSYYKLEMLEKAKCDKVSAQYIIEKM